MGREDAVEPFERERLGRRRSGPRTRLLDGTFVQWEPFAVGSGRFVRRRGSDVVGRPVHAEGLGGTLPNAIRADPGGRNSCYVIIPVAGRLRYQVWRVDFETGRASLLRNVEGEVSDFCARSTIDSNATFLCCQLWGDQDVRWVGFSPELPSADLVDLRLNRFTFRDIGRPSRLWTFDWFRLKAVEFVGQRQYTVAKHRYPINDWGRKLCNDDVTRTCDERRLVFADSPNALSVWRFREETVRTVSLPRFRKRNLMLDVVEGDPIPRLWYPDRDSDLIWVCGWDRGQWTLNVCDLNRDDPTCVLHSFSLKDLWRQESCNYGRPIHFEWIRHPCTPPDFPPCVRLCCGERAAWFPGFSRAPKDDAKLYERCLSSLVRPGLSALPKDPRRAKAHVDRVASQLPAEIRCDLWSLAVNQGCRWDCEDWLFGNLPKGPWTKHFLAGRP